MHLSNMDRQTDGQGDSYTPKNKHFACRDIETSSKLTLLYQYTGGCHNSHVSTIQYSLIWHLKCVWFYKLYLVI